MKDKIYDSPMLSVKPRYMKLILVGEKKYEFRNFKPNYYNDYFWIYESTPSKELKYLMKIKSIVVFPCIIYDDSYGVDRFNSGEMKNRYAYEIEELYSLEEPLTLNELKDSYNFTAPQAYTYLKNNKKLREYLINFSKLNQIF